VGMTSVTLRPGPTGLPVEDVVGAVVAALAGRGLAVLQAEPGAGKTTVVPLRLLGQPWLGGQRILLLQPRRVAARAAARRMSQLVSDEVGGLVGYRTRDDRRVGPRTRIEVVTDGILTRRLQADPSLPGVGLIIFDEFHERRLQADLGLALTLEARTGLRPELRVLVMSATLAADPVAELLGRSDGSGPAPVVRSAGRAFPVEAVWAEAPMVGSHDPVPGTVRLVARALRERKGDVLVFLPGVGEIARAARVLDGILANGQGLSPVDVRPLHGSLPPAAQDAALSSAPVGTRKVVLATDVAETSLTVEGVTVVVDAGRARSPRFDPGSGLTRLVTGPASRASADQRAGRAGRTGPGTVYRTWTVGEHRARRAFADPEILAVDLTALALELAVWGADADQLVWLDRPPAPALAEGRRLLHELGALDVPGSKGRPTAAGRAMADLPLHPRLAHMVLAAHPDRAWLACTLAALVEEADVLRRVDERPVSADVAERLRAVGRDREAPDADRRRLEAVRRRSTELLRRSGHARVSTGHASTGGTFSVGELAAAGPLLALAYPDRLAQGRGEGRFRLRDGPAVRVPSGDALGSEAFLVVADVGGTDPATGVRREGLVRLAAGIDQDDLEALAGDAVQRSETLVWEGDDLRLRTERRLGAIVLASRTGPPVPGPALADALVARVEEAGLAVLGWDDAAHTLQDRVAFAAASDPAGWPELSEAALMASVGDWLAPRLVRARGAGDLARVSMSTVLRDVLGPAALHRLEVMAPSALSLPGGRRLSLDYAEHRPSARVRAQDLFGQTTHPSVGPTRVPVVLHILSPAGRPVQVTADLPGFWAGSWLAVRKELAGRYPKHAWPTDPATAPAPRAARPAGARSRRV
jgi:ATP-dependent helicase HrpB